MSTEDEEQDALKHLASWGRQTIAFAMSLRAVEIGKPIDGSNRVNLAGTEANKIAQDFWNEVSNECRKHPQLTDMWMKFTKKIFDWVHDHLAT